jgi:hypothetical protein
MPLQKACSSKRRGEDFTSWWLRRIADHCIRIVVIVLLFSSVEALQKACRSKRRGKILLGGRCAALPRVGAKHRMRVQCAPAT